MTIINTKVAAMEKIALHIPVNVCRIRPGNAVKLFHSPVDYAIPSYKKILVDYFFLMIRRD